MWRYTQNAQQLDDQQIVPTTAAIDEVYSVG